MSTGFDQLEAYAPEWRGYDAGPSSADLLALRRGEVIRLYSQLGMTYEQIGQRMGVSKSRVGQHVASWRAAQERVQRRYGWTMHAATEATKELTGPRIKGFVVFRPAIRELLAAMRLEAD